MAIGSWRFLLASLALGLAGCTSDSPIRTVDYSLYSDYNYSPQYLQWAAAYGPVWLQVRDSPYPGGDAAMAEALAAVSSGEPANIRPHYTPDPAEAGQTQTRVVYAFYPALSVTSWQVCDPWYNLPHSLPGDRLELMVAFCFDAYPVSALGVSAPPLPPGDETALRQVADRVMVELFSPPRHGADLHSNRRRRN